MNQFNILQANSTHIEAVAPLFNSYHQFYGQTADLIQVRNFLYERFIKKDSVILIAVTPHHPFNCLGFTQLYPSFSSVAMQRTWILNDLFVLPKFRYQGVGTALLNAAKDFAIHTKAKRLTLATATNNHAAQKLYEKAGYTKDETFYHYQLDVSIPSSNEFNS